MKTSILTLINELSSEIVMIDQIDEVGLISKLDLDELDQQTLLLAIENKFNIFLPISDLSKLDTIHELMEIVGCQIRIDKELSINKKMESRKFKNARFIKIIKDGELYYGRTYTNVDQITGNTMNLMTLISENGDGRSHTFDQFVTPESVIEYL